ncbi:MAG: hypothetical protein HZB16_14050 [Armatimonadetes bacterium]|nr:hypothetical protein [Armatimonadota bacterium]
MLTSSSPLADFAPLVDEQMDLGDPPSGKPTTAWQVGGQHNGKFPFACVVDLGRELPLATLWLFDTYNNGDVLIQTGSPEAWQDVATVNTNTYMSWKSVTLERPSRYLRLELRQPSAIFAEIALDAYSPAGWKVLQDRLAADKAREAERQAALAKAKDEALKRPVITLAPYGRLSLVDEVDCAAAGADHQLSEAPQGASSVAEILGRRCRVVAPKPGEGSYVSYRLGRMKLLRPGAAYVLVIDYPEDAPRSTAVLNTGCESSLGFYTGLCTGDALRAKYVNSNVESLNLPLSGRWQQWTNLFRLHDRFPEKGLLRGDPVRKLTPEDGFDVTIATMSAENDPLSRGPAVARIALYEVIDEDQLAQPLALPPRDLPHRRIFWREEMADGVIQGKTPETRGVLNELDWYRNKADLMRHLGINTYTKDLLEFGACQHWDSTPYGGNAWVHHDGRTKDLWGKIVAMMGKYGYDVVPYYEYAGSKGDKGLGYQKRCKPLTRDDAYTHINWIESSNADVTDPDTLADFQKMLDCTVVSLADKASFPGVWIRTRSQLPVGFGDATRERFAKEANGGTAVTREQLKADKALYAKYIAWWEQKRRDFFAGVRDYLRAKGLANAFVLYTGCPGEPGVEFADWEPRLVTDAPTAWAEVLAQKAQFQRDKQVPTITPSQVVEQGLFMKGLLAPGKNWGNWEVHHAHPADDPVNYQKAEGLMLAHAFNRLYTVSDPATLNLFRTPAGLTLVRHYPLNENMMFDKADQDRLGYFVCDYERAGPYCMMAEAIALANGDPTQFAYLTGGNYGRGFGQYVRDFNANFLALPALPSRRLEGAASDAKVVVRQIDTPTHGTWLAVVNTAMTEAKGVKVKVPGGAVKVAVGGKELPAAGGQVSLDLRPYQLVTLTVGAK